MEVLHRGCVVKDNGIVINKYGKEIGYQQINGYKYILIDGKQKLMHRFIWEAFNGEIPDGMEIDHINTIRSDNRLENLRLVTSSENKRNNITIDRYKISNKNKPHTKCHHMKSSMNMWFQNLIRRYHKNGNKYIYQDI